MNLEQLDFCYPEELISLSPSRPSRVLDATGPSFIETDISHLLSKFSQGDVLVLNNTKVSKRRVRALGKNDEEIEVLFADQLNENRWSVLAPLSRIKGSELKFPDGVLGKVVEKGLPQIIELDQNLREEYFQMYGEVPLPPYIQSQRRERIPIGEDENWYQSKWAEKIGSSAAPTASLHFTNEDISILKERGVNVVYVTLHVGLGTYLPVKVLNLDEHRMHSEFLYVSKEAWNEIIKSRESGKRIWSLGTTTTRALESIASKKIRVSENGDYFGSTDLFIKEGYDFKIVDVLMTNFHQPKTTLLAMVCTFAGSDRVLKGYSWAIERQFKLFSYGDLSVWSGNP